MSDTKITLISAIIAGTIYFLICRLPERIKTIAMIITCGVCCGWCLYPIIAMEATDPRLKLGAVLCAIGAISWISVLIKNIKGGKHVPNEN